MKLVINFIIHRNHNHNTIIVVYSFSKEYTKENFYTRLNKKNDTVKEGNGKMNEHNEIRT